ncbi:Protein of unknown function [Pyronema omphalodes CBS 100304]|uniref:Uncharacterized protein n=1 Tax=Pyronema omphalodes (strain CBS 100304) TaxID=1076935 RepID=U4LBW0_PYROM|nr:Protein of unknown function [Pyronema omphalodes CBS 100304]
MKFLILAIGFATSFIPTILSTPVATNIAIKRLETSKAAADKDTFKPSWYTMFKKRKTGTAR